MADDTPLLDTLAAMTAASLESCSLEPRELMLARIAALAAAGAPPASYLANAGTASDLGITLEDVQGVLIAVAPIVGTARTVSAAGNIARALGFAIAAIEAEVDAELAAEGY
jgi:Na+/H+-dicarboxylate symporter